MLFFQTSEELLFNLSFLVTEFDEIHFEKSHKIHRLQRTNEMIRIKVVFTLSTYELQAPHPELFVY